MPKLNSSTTDCFCATDFDCQSPTFIGIYRLSGGYAPNSSYVIPGAIQGCFTFDSVLLSTLECFYSNSDCLSKIKYFVNMSFDGEFRPIVMSKLPWINVRPLANDSTTSRFTPETPFSVIVKAMMIEEWNQTFSFESYYEACKPNYCTYSYEAYTQSFIEVIIKVVSMLGGLIAALRFITKQLVELVFGLFKPKVQRQEQGIY